MRSAGSFGLDYCHTMLCTCNPEEGAKVWSARAGFGGDLELLHFYKGKLETACLNFDGSKLIILPRNVEDQFNQIYNTVVLIDLQTMEIHRDEYSHRDEIDNVYASPTKNLMITCTLYNALVWDISRGLNPLTFFTEQGVYFAAFHPITSKVVLQLQDLFTLTTWNWTNEETIALGETETYIARVFDFSQSGDRFVCGCGERITMFDTSSHEWKEMLSWSIFNSSCVSSSSASIDDFPLSSVRFSPSSSDDHKVLTARAESMSSLQMHVQVWNGCTGECLRVVLVAGVGVHCRSGGYFFSDEMIVVQGPAGTIYVSDANTGNQIGEWTIEGPHWTLTDVVPTVPMVVLL